MTRLTIYPSTLPGESVETHDLGGKSLGEWLSSRYSGYDPVQPQPFLCKKDGMIIPPSEWATLRGDLYMYFKPQGGALDSIGSILSAILSPILSFLVPTASTPNTSTPQQGEQITAAEGKANTPKLNDVIPEGFGLWRRYPDYLLPPFRRFVDKYEQDIYLMLCVGAGKYQIQSSRVKVGDTPLIALGDNAEFQIYQPGEDVSGEEWSQWWYSSPEVGGTSKGSAGLELTATSEIEVTPEATAFIFDGDLVTIPTGAGEFPTGWTSGLIVRTELPREYNVTGGTTITRAAPLDFDELDPFVGMVLEIAGDNEGLYKVRTYTPYSAAVPPVAGSASTFTASAAPSTYDFATSPETFDVILDGSTYPIVLSSDVTDMSGLLSSLNSQLPAEIVASESGGVVVLTEQAPYSGTALTASPAPSSVFGGSPVAVTGTATSAGSAEVLAAITLEYDDGSPVTALTNGTKSMSIGYRGLRYRTTSAGTYSITVDRLTDTGATDTGWGGFEYTESNAALVQLDASNTEGDWSGPFVAAPDGELATDIEWDILFDKGLVYYTKEGAASTSVVVGIELQYRDADIGGAWTSVDREYVEASKDQVGFTESVTLPYAMRPEVRVRREQAPQANTRSVENAVWYGLRAKLQGGPTEYENVTTIGLRIRGGQRISAQTENKISLEALRVLPERSGGAWTVETPTRSIAAAMAHIAKSIGYTDDDLDLEEMDSLNDIWEARGDTFDFFFDETTVRDGINTVLRAGFAEMTVDRGLVRPVRDEPRTEFEQMYTPQNMTDVLRAGVKMPSQDDFDGVDVEFVNGLTWATETAECRLPGDVGEKVEKIKLEGVTDRTKAWRIGMRRRAIQKYRRRSYDGSTELDAMNSGYLAYVALADDVPGYGQSSILLGINGETLTVTEPMAWEAGADHVVGIRNTDGTLNGPYPATRGASDYEIIADGLSFTMPGSGIEPPHVLFGTVTRWTYPALITQVRPNGFDSVNFSAVNYDDRVYANDDNAPS